MSKTSQNTTKKLVLSALFLALTLVLPFLTGQIQQIGGMLLPMHLPVILCGFVCGAPYAALVGFVAPLLRSLIFTMPPMVPVAIVMAFELAVYGFVSGFLYKKMPKNVLYIYINLVITLIVGRVALGCANMLIFATIMNAPYTWAMFMAGAFTSAIPGIILQLVLVPLVVAVLEKAKLIPID